MNNLVKHTIKRQIAGRAEDNNFLREWGKRHVFLAEELEDNVDVTYTFAPARASSVDWPLNLRASQNDT